MTQRAHARVMRGRKLRGIRKAKKKRNKAAGNMRMTESHPTLIRAHNARVTRGTVIATFTTSGISRRPKSLPVADPAADRKADLKTRRLAGTEADGY